MVDSSGEASQYPSRIWRVRALIRVGCALQSLAWLALIVALPGRDGDSDPVLVGLGLGALIVLPPFLAFWPVIRLQPGGALLLRGWTRSHRATADEIVRLSMTQFGLRVVFEDGSAFTSVIFQATAGRRRPRVLTFVDAVTRGVGGVSGFDPWDLRSRSEIELYSRDAAKE